MSFFNVSNELQALSDKAMLKCEAKFREIDKITEYNQQKVLKAFINNGVSDSHFNSSTGYGYGDRGREVLDEVTAEIFGAEDAIIRHSFASGTHTLCVMLFGVLRPGDNVLCVTGTPYDTIHSVIGLTGEGMGSLKDFGVTFDIVDLLPDGTVDYEKIGFCDEIYRWLEYSLKQPQTESSTTIYIEHFIEMLNCLKGQREMEANAKIISDNINDKNCEGM